MRFTLVVTSHGRWNYLDQMMRSLAPHMHLFRHRIYSFDGCGTNETVHLDDGSVVVNVSTGQKRKGLTANLAQAWGALTPEDEWVFHVEEDFLIHDAPLAEMAATLEAFPHIANMVLVRQPWNAEEQRAGSVLKAQRYHLEDRGGWLEHTGGFWLNPMVAHASLLRTLQPGVENALTEQCRARHLSFGYWGSKDDPPRVTHIGAEGGMGSKGWRP